MRLRPFILALLVLASPLFAKQPAMTKGATSIEVSFHNGDVTLAGSFLLPARETPVAALVLLPGSGPETREALRPIAIRLVADGYAALIFDKRGTGASSGSWVSASLDDLAADGLSAVRYLRSRKEIDPEKIGILAVSQSGWIAPIIANREPGVRFMIVVTGGGVSPREVEWFGYEAEMKHRGLSDEERTTARRLVRRYFDYLATGHDREGLLAAISAAEKEPWYAAVPVGRILPSEKNRAKWAWVATYDPVVDIERLRIPVLLLFGGRDRTPADLSVSRWTTGLARSDAPPPTVRVFPEAGHGMTIGGHGPGPHRYAVGYFEMVDAWIRSVVRASPM